MNTENIEQIPDILKNSKIAFQDDIKLYVNTAAAVNEVITWKEDLQYPILKHQIVGNITYTIEDKEYSSDLYSVDLLLPPDVEKAVSSVYYALIGLLIVFILVVIAEFIIFKRIKKKKTENSEK